MGGGASRNKQPSVPIPRFSSPAASGFSPISGYGPQGPASGFPPISGYPPQGFSSSPFNISRPGSPVMSPNMMDVATLNRRQQRKLEDANRTINTLQNQMVMMQRNSMGTPPPYGGQTYSGPPPMYPPPPMHPNSYPPPSPILQRYAGQSHYPNPQQQMPGNPIGYRDTDFAAVANIAGLNPADIALLHREYMGLTRGGMSKIDRVVFRQLLREAMIEANNENVDRAIENIFVSIDRNHDGFIDFSEFVGAFRDVLRGGPTDPQTYAAQHVIPDLINEQIRGYSSNSNPFLQSQSSGQFISLPSSTPQQSPLLYNGTSPLVISLDSNQSPYMLNQGQH